MVFEGAVVREQGVTFAIAVVKKRVLDFRPDADRAAASFAGAFGGLPVVLMAQDAGGQAQYYGRKDIVRFLAHISINQIPWRRYTIN